MTILGLNVATLRVGFLGAFLAFQGVASISATEGISVFPDPNRIVAVGGSITEIVYALGEEKRLIARDFHQRLSRGGVQSSRCRLHACAVARRCALGKAFSHLGT